ncbi:NfeD family protein [Hymenobacter sp. BT175]|uniref:NfeD family protein n=1 Tax=Hymenobacter translucens TaxID=2886507 RepID=UPI001D0EC558|nr:NfeD family protein [Hymenobacter translucens]MCC2545862.1 NfeD family protein [Hymenobacter translucens]
MDWITVAVLLLFGLIFLVAEVVFIPGTTLVGLVGLVLLTAGVWLGYRDLGTPAGHYALGISAVLVAATVYVGLRPKNLARFALTDVNHSRVRDVRNPDVQPGTTGRTLSALRPAGTALFDDDRREVVTRGEFVPAGAVVRVLGIEQNRIVVEKAGV